MLGVKLRMKNKNPKELKISKEEPRKNMLREENLKLAKECKPMKWTFVQENLYPKNYDDVKEIEKDARYLKYYNTCADRKKVVKENPKPQIK